MSLISVRYAQHPLFGPALDRNNPPTTRRKNCFFFGPLLIVLSVDLFFLASYVYNTPYSSALLKPIVSLHISDESHRCLACYYLLYVLFFIFTCVCFFFLFQTQARLHSRASDLTWKIIMHQLKKSKINEE